MKSGYTAKEIKMASATDRLKEFQENLENGNTQKDPRDKLIEELDKLSNDYNNRAEAAIDLPDAPIYDRMEYNPVTDEEIEKQAESGLADYKNTSINNIEANTEAAKAAKEAERRAAEESAAKLQASVAAQYDNAMAAFSDDALKRGLARSSIAANKSAELQSGKAEALAQAAATAETVIGDIDKQINSLEVSREKALNDFNIAYAAKVTEKIVELTKERDNKVAEVLKYNNGLAQQEQKDALDRAQAVSKLYSEKLAQEKDEKYLGNYDTAANDFNRAKYEVIRNYLSTLGKTDASKAVKDDPIIRETLNDYYYYTLYNEYCK